MPPDCDFEEYEQEYLKRMGLETEGEGAVARLRREASESPLDPWDYAVLEMVRRDDLAIPLKLGTMRAAKSFLKLHCHGMICKPDRKPAFDEMERIQAFLDSAVFDSYKSNLKKIMTREAAAFFQMVAKITGVNDTTDMCKLTPKGQKALAEERARAAKVCEEINRQYRLDSADFYERASEHESHLPLMVIMGLVSGSMLAHMQAASDAQYGILADMAVGNVHFEGACGLSGFGDSGFGPSFEF